MQLWRRRFRHRERAVVAKAVRRISDELLIRRIARVPAHLILQPVAWPLLPALCNGLLLVAANLRQLSDVMTVSAAVGCVPTASSVPT
jgi:hypothetical protein